MARFVYYLVPNFHNFNAIDSASHGHSIPFSLIGQNTLYARLVCDDRSAGRLGRIFGTESQVKHVAPNPPFEPH